MTAYRDPLPAEQRPARPKRLCMSPDECFQAGWDDGARLGERMTPRQRERLAILLRPYFGADAERTTA